MIGMEEGFEFLKSRVSEIEEKNGRLEVENRRLKDELELGVGKIKKLEMEEARLGEEVCVLSRRNREFAERVEWFEGGDVGGDSGESSGFYKVMVENEILKCEKRMAEEEAKRLKEKVVELEARVAQLEGKRIGNGVDLRTRCGDMKAEAGDEFIDLNMPDFLAPCEREWPPSSTKDGLSGIPSLTTPCPITPSMRRGNMFCKSKNEYPDRLNFKRKVMYNNESSLDPTMVNSSGVGIIDISDSDEDKKLTQKKRHLHAAMTPVPVNACSNDEEEVFVIGSLKRSPVESSSSELLNVFKESATPKRKRVSNVVASDSECDDIPIGMLYKKSVADQDQKSSSEDEVDTILTNATQSSVPPRRQRLISLSQRCGANVTGTSRTVDKNPSKHGSGIHRAVENVSDDGLEDAESESEGESLGGFIVKTSDSNSGNSSTNDFCSDGNNASVESHLQSDSDMEYPEILSKLRRDKDPNMKWESEGDMLAALGKDSEYCLQAVCALYRRQTSDEQDCKGTIHANGRGFNCLDARRGSEIAEFLTDGDRFGPVVKSAEELEKYYPNGVEICRDLARRYSKQLYSIFQNKEDPLFHSGS